MLEQLLLGSKIAISTVKPRLDKHFTLENLQERASVEITTNSKHKELRELSSEEKAFIRARLIKQSQV